MNEIFLQYMQIFYYVFSLKAKYSACVLGIAINLK